MNRPHEENEKSVVLAYRVRALLAEDSIGVDDAQWGLLERHVSLVKEWNRVVGVVATAEVDKLWERHVADSLSLAAVVARLGLASGHLVDVGSGGGFPAVPMKVVLRGLRVTLVERSEKKAGFLRKVVAALRLSDVSIRVGEFPRIELASPSDVITARAVESPERVTARILDALGEQGVFLSQSGIGIGGGYSVERVDDGWTAAGLRRGTLEVVRRQS